MKRLNYLLLICFSFIICNNHVSASHMAAADLGIVCTGGNNYTITLVIYRDCTGIIAPSTVNIYLDCPLCPATGFVEYSVPQAPGSGQVVTVSCPSMPTQCNGGVLYGVEAYIYQANVVLAPCANWIVSWNVCCRNPSNTISSPTSTNFYIEARLNNLDAPSSSTPLLTNYPVTILCTQQTLCQNPGAIDLDGDSISYELVNPIASYSMSTGYSYVSFIPPCSATQPLPSSPPVSINPYNGDLCITPTMNVVGPLKLEIKKWRTINGVPTVIGVTGRDMQVNSIYCNSLIPVLGGMDPTLSNGYDPNDTLFYAEVCAKDTIRFAIWGYDPDTFNVINQGSPEQFSIFWNQAIQTANFTAINQSTDSSYAIFTWVPSQLDALLKPHCFMATIRDKACPYYLSRNYIYCIKVNPSMNVDIGPGHEICPGDSVTFQAIADSGTVNYLWKVNGVPTGTPPSSSQFTFHSTGLPSGIHTVSIETNNGNPAILCFGKDYAIVEVLVAPNPYLGNDTMLGINSSLTLNPGLFSSFLWSTGSIAQIITLDTSLLGSGTHLVWVKVTDSMGCSGSDTIQVSFVQNPGFKEHQNTPVIRVFPNPTSGSFNIQFSEYLSKAFVVQLTATDGKVVYENKFEISGKPYQIQLNPGSLAAGVYTLNIIAEDGVVVDKLLIKGK